MQVKIKLLFHYIKRLLFFFFETEWSKQKKAQALLWEVFYIAPNSLHVPYSSQPGLNRLILRTEYLITFSLYSMSQLNANHLPDHLSSL